MDDGNSRKLKSVRFNQETQVLLFETPHSDDDNGASMSTRSPVTRPTPCSVRERASRYDEKVSRRSAPQQPRPPALPPRNAVPVPVNRAETQKPSPPKPPPRAKNNSTACLPKVRIFRRDPNARPATEGPSRRGEASALLGREAAPVISHSRMKVPDKPPPPPPLAPLAPLAPTAPSTSSALSEPSVDDGGICRADLNRPDASQEQADGTDADDDDDRPSGCTAGCILFIVGLIR